ncbi:polymeric immunoglobulin receptor-like [Hoplias malabaricus]|uniref:polymeric immunoglobulin receptor-like n=1 Tax=Hoplias malabaricus TaxID=27720 RepID=UPI00346355C3
MVDIPCHYDMKYRQHNKYWCYDARGAFNYCKILAYGNTTRERVTVIDSPAQSLFTVTMSDLQSGDTGMYWCVVEIGGHLEPDDKEQFYITVKSDPDLSVMHSSVSGHEGGMVSVNCLYSSNYQKKKKQWCRSKDWSCYTVGRTKTSQNSSVQISEAGTGSFSVNISELKKSDAGWYWCKTETLQIPVHLFVSDAIPVSTSVTRETDKYLMTTIYSTVTTPKNTNDTNKSKREQDNRHRKMLDWLLLAAILGLLLILLSFVACILKKKHSKYLLTLFT